MTRPLAESSPHWIELFVLADAESVEPVAALFRRYGHNQGVVIEEPYRQDQDGEHFEIDPTRPVVVRTYIPEDERAPETRQKLDEGLWHLRQLGQVGRLEERTVREEDWADAWKRHFNVQRIGRRFVIQPSWCEYDPQPDDLVIQLDPGMAFGTGSHPTTETCLRFIEDLDFGGKQVLDAGAGSGILSVAACLRGARHVDAVELDPYAADTLRRNLEQNGVEDRVNVIVGPVGSSIPKGKQYDIVLANIIARVLIEDAGSLGVAVARGGQLVASGVIAEYERAVTDALGVAGLRVSERRVAGDWVTLLLEREPS